MKFYKFFIIGVILSLILGINAVQSQPRDEASESTSIIDCMKGWRQFLSSIIGYESITEYGADIIRPNLCHKTDIEMVERQIRKARTQVKTTFMRCDLKNLDRFTKAYYKLEAELYFLRNAFSENIKADVISRIENEDDIENLISKMKDFFVLEKGFLTEELLRQYVYEFAAKYRQRLNDYQNCRNDFYEELGAKWDELMQNFKDFGKVFEGEDEETKKRKEAMTEPNPRKGPIISADEDLDVNLLLGRLKVSPEKSFSDLVNEVTAKKPGLGPSVPMFNVQSLIANEKSRVLEEKSQKELEAYYKHLYGEMSDAATNDLVLKINELITVVQESYPYMEKLEKCVDEVESRECKNK